MFRLHSNLFSRVTGECIYSSLGEYNYVIVFNPPYCFKLSYCDIYYYTKVPILSNSIAKLERNLITKLVPFHRVPSVPTCTHSFLIHKVPCVLVILTRDLQNDTFNGDQLYLTLMFCDVQTFRIPSKLSVLLYLTTQQTTRHGK